MTVLNPISRLLAERLGTPREIARVHRALARDPRRGPQPAPGGPAALPAGLHRGDRKGPDAVQPGDERDYDPLDRHRAAPGVPLLLGGQLRGGRAGPLVADVVVARRRPGRARHALVHRASCCRPRAGRPAPTTCSSATSTAGRTTTSRRSATSTHELPDDRRRRPHARLLRGHRAAASASCGPTPRSLQRMLAVPRMAREFHRLRPRLAALESEVVLCEEQVETALHAGSALALGAAMDRATAMLDEAWDVHYSTTSSLDPRGRDPAQDRPTSCCRPGTRSSGWSTSPTSCRGCRLFDGALATEDDALPALAVLRDRRRLRAVARLLARLHAAAGDRRARARAPTTSPRSCGRCTAGCARSASSSSRARSTTTCRRARRASRWRCARCTSSGARCPRWPRRPA